MNFHCEQAAREIMEYINRCVTVGPLEDETHATVEAEIVGILVEHFDEEEREKHDYLVSFHGYHINDAPLLGRTVIFNLPLVRACDIESIEARITHDSTTVRKASILSIQRFPI